MADEVSFVDVIFEGYSCLVEVGETWIVPGCFWCVSRLHFKGYSEIISTGT